MFQTQLKKLSHYELKLIKELEIMNETLESALALLINKTLEGVDTAGEFLVAETPLVIEQLLLWYLVYKGLLAVIGVLLFCGLCKTALWLDKPHNGVASFLWCDDRHGGLELSGMIIPALSAWVITATVTCFLINLEWLQIWIAPKVWLLEYVSKIAQ